MNTMRITAISSAALSLLVIAGCNKEEGTLINSAGTTFQALTENSMTRTVLGDGDSEVLRFIARKRSFAGTAGCAEICSSFFRTLGFPDGCPKRQQDSGIQEPLRAPEN